jgi:trehalose 6-phosphate phosphatase
VPESSQGSDWPLAHALSLARDALEAGPAGLLTDFDGTLSPIVEDPASARLVHGAEPALRSLSRRLEVVAVITGRAPVDARRATGVAELLVVGNHGTEWLLPGSAQPEVIEGGDAARMAVHEALRSVEGVPNVEIERKGLSATIHYRRSPAPDQTRRTLLDRLLPASVAVDVREGRMSVEIRPAGLGDKGSATRAIVERHGLRGIVVMGDDVTDLDMFHAAAELRERDGVRAAIVAVGGGDREVPTSVVEAADVVLPTPGEVAALLSALAE